MTVALPTRTRRSDRDRTMVTPEGIALPLALASRGSRFGALMLDLMFIGLLMILTTIVLIATAGGTAALSDPSRHGPAIMHALEFLAVIWIAAMFLFRNAYFLFFELGPRGATPGKRITGIRIAARDGGRLTAEMVIARNLLRDIELFLPLVFIASASDGGDSGVAGMAALAWFLIFAFFPFFNKDRLRAGDIIAGTWVVEAPKRKLEAAMSAQAKAVTGARVASQESAVKYRFGNAELSVYGEYELQTLERVLRENRPDAIRQVYEAICKKIGWTVGGGDEYAFLDAFYTQLRARLEAGMRMGKRKADKFAGN
ncbi:MAG: RDD family protein, partial [Novosphingobium sp.]